MTLNPTYRASFWVLWDYLFTENQIMQIEIAPSYQYASIFLMVTGILYIVGLPGFLDLRILRALAVPFGIIIGLFSWQLLAIHKRQRLHVLQLDDILRNAKITSQIPWSDVSLFECQGRRIRFQANKKVYRGIVALTDVEPLREFVRSKVGERLLVR